MACLTGQSVRAAGHTFLIDLPAHTASVKCTHTCTRCTLTCTQYLSALRTAHAHVHMRVYAYVNDTVRYHKSKRP